MARERRRELSVDRLRPRDLALFEALWEGRFVTAEQAARYIWNDRNSANRRLKQLEAAGYLLRAKDYLLRLTTLRPAPMCVEALRVRGIIPENEQYGVWSWKQLHEREIGFIRHEAAVNEFRFCLYQACRQTGGRIKLLSIRCGPAIVTEFTWEGRHSLLRPDRRVELAVPGAGRPQLFFLEVDRATKPILRTRGRDILGQLRMYEAYFAATGQAFRVLMTCPTVARMENILAAIENRLHVASGSIAMAVWDDVLSDPLGSVWKRLGEPNRLYSIAQEWPQWPTY